jgi:hypothetical protein
MGIAFDDGDSSGNTSDLNLQNVDIHAIIRTFTQQQPAAEASIQQLPPNLDTTEFAGSSEFASSTNEYNSFNEHETLSGDYSTFLYDPIFGFDGTAFDDLDFGFGTDFCWVDN